MSIGAPAGYEHLLRRIEAGTDGKKHIAFFDFDKTLIAGYSAVALLKAQLSEEQLGRVDILQQFLAVGAHSAGILDFDELVKTSALVLEGQREEDFIELADLIYRRSLRKIIYPEAAEVILAHKRKGHEVVVVSSATRYQIEPVAHELGITTILATKFEVDDGVLTGELDGPACFGNGKVDAAKAYCRKRRKTLANSYFYSDSIDDLPLLEAVGSPVPLNPDGKLADIAAEKGWQTYAFDSRRKPTLGDIARTCLMYSSIVPSALLGLYTKMQGEATRDAAQLAYRNFAGVGMTLAGVKLNIKGEENLWAHRPAVFVTNHQSILDGFIVPHLIQSDITVMGKKEARDMPLIGKTMESAGFILFDRSDPEAGRAACAQAAEDIRNGYSLAIAPEGTRSYTGKLEPFKKGAFHVAMQTNVPIVPIVIKNAAAFWPRGENFVRPGIVDVEVLKPVSTDDWTPENLGEKVEQLRGQYLKALGQKE